MHRMRLLRGLLPPRRYHDEVTEPEDSSHDTGTVAHFGIISLMSPARGAAGESAGNAG